MKHKEVIAKGYVIAFTPIIFYITELRIKMSR